LAGEAFAAAVTTLARGLINRPRLLLLDEPLGALDAKLREQMERELIALQREVGVTFVFVTHSQQEALALSHRIAVMNAGHVEQADTPERIYGYPKNRFVADFIGTINLLPVEVREATPARLHLLAGGLGAGDVWPFALVCLLSGAALGADLTLPAALLADLAEADGRSARAGAYFGWWNLVAKLNLALAAGQPIDRLKAAMGSPLRAAVGLAGACATA